MVGKGDIFSLKETTATIIHDFMKKISIRVKKKRREAL
jgi:hypothetical protein